MFHDRAQFGCLAATEKSLASKTGDAARPGAKQKARPIQTRAHVAA
jgi:hypothetical protein